MVKVMMASVVVAVREGMAEEEEEG